MADYMMFNRTPGGIPVNEAEHALLITEGPPDVVRLPPELGGRVVKVVRAFSAPWPPPNGTPCRHLELENGICVAEADKFYWYRPKKPLNPPEKQEKS